MATFSGAWHALADYLAVRGPRTFFTLPGDDLAVLSAAERCGLRPVLTRDQRAAVHMATGFAVQSGRATLCAIGKGPAVANAMSGLLEAWCAGAPLVLVSGGTGADRRGSGAFQEVDQLPLLSSLTKWSHRVDDPERVAPAVVRAFQIAAGGVPGPVYLELPDHLCQVPVPRRGPWPEPPVLATGGPVRTPPALLQVLRRARRPVLLLGGGMRHAADPSALAELAVRMSAAVFVTASGRGTVGEDHPGFCGLAGLYTPELARPLWESTDLVLAFGTRLEETTTFPSGFAPPGTPVVQVNLDPAGWSAEVSGPRVLGDGSAVARQWLNALDRAPTDAMDDSSTDEAERDSWRARVTACRGAMHVAATAELAAMGRSSRIHVAEVLAALAAVAPADRILVQENGLQDMWSYFYPYWSCPEGSGSIVPSEQTTLGFGTLAAAGAALATDKRLVVSFGGDGAFAVARSELPGLVEAGVGVLFIVLDNGGYGWLEHQWRTTAGGRSRYRFVQPGACPSLAPEGVWRTRVQMKSELGMALARALDVVAEGNPAVVEIPVDLSDVPPGISELHGDFPGAGVVPSPVTSS